MSNVPWPEQYAELCELIQLLFDERITPEQRTQLATLLHEDREARRVYVQYVNLYATLHWEQSQEPQQPSHRTKAQPPGSPVSGFISECFHQGVSFLSKSNIFSVLVAVGLPGIVLLVLALHVMRQPAPPTSVATLTRAHECVWEKQDVSPVVGGDLTPGQQLFLSEGLAEITFADGATVLLEGPSRFQADGRAKGFLHAGRLVAKVRKEAKGFAVETPSARIVDLGTEFGLAVAENGTAEAHVFQGEVEVVTRPAIEHVVPSTKHLHAGQAVQVSAEEIPQLVAMAAVDGKFARHVPGTLARPTILFAHHGSTDPATEGWRLVSSDRNTDVEMGPVDQDGTAAWSFRFGENKQVAYYVIQEGEGLDPKLVAEAKQKGWVMRARLWISDQSQRPGERHTGLCHFSYSDGERTWVLHPSLSRNGDQLLLVCGDSSFSDPGVHGAVPVPGSRNRYVDYELRYDPATKSADVYVNGRRVATGFSNLRKSKSGPTLRFGMWRLASNTRYALFEWGILRETPNTAAGFAESNRDE